MQMDVRIIMTNGSDVALEMTDIDRIESYLVMQDVKQLVAWRHSANKH